MPDEVEGPPRGARQAPRAHPPFMTAPTIVGRQSPQLSLMRHVATLATLSKSTAAAATSAQIVKFMAAEW